MSPLSPPATCQACAIIVGGIGSALLFDFQITPRFNLGVGLVIGSIFLYGSKKEQLVACADCSTWHRPAWRRPTWMMRYVPLSTTESEIPSDEEDGQLLPPSASDDGSQMDEASPAVSRRKIGADAA